MIEIAGDYLEGGGQILRTSLALSSILGKPVHLRNIRAKRPDPGLKAQHFTGFRVMSELTSAIVEGLYINSQEVKFIPRGFFPRDLNINIGTAGSIGLLLQVLLLPLSLKSEKEVNLKIKGGTHVMKAIPIDYFINIISPILKKAGVIVEIGLIRHGYYPRGGGEVEVRIYPWKDRKPILLKERGKFIRIKGISHASEALRGANVAERQKDLLLRLLEKRYSPLDIEVKYYNSLSPGSGIVLWAEFENTILGADALGEKGKPAERVAEDAAGQLLKEIDSGAGCDSHLADNLIPWLAFSGGEIYPSEISLHTRTNIWVVEQFLGKTFQLESNHISNLFTKRLFLS